MYIIHLSILNISYPFITPGHSTLNYCLYNNRKSLLLQEFLLMTFVI
jgi:hypothetical protein